MQEGDKLCRGALYPIIKARAHVTKHSLNLVCPIEPLRPKWRVSVPNLQALVYFAALALKRPVL